MLPEASSSCRPARSASARPRYSAVRVGGERAYKRARRGEDVEMPPRIVERPPLRAARARGRAGRVRDRVLVGHLRAQPDRRPRATPTARSCGARRSARSPSRRRTRATARPRRGAGARACRRDESVRPMVKGSAEHPGHPPPRGRAAPAPGRDRDLRRRPRRPPGGDRRRRHRAHLRAPPAQRDPPGGGAEADHAVRDQARRDRRASASRSWS